MGLGSAVDGVGGAIGGVQRKLSENKEAKRASADLAKQAAQREREDAAVVRAQAEARQTAQAAKTLLEGTLGKANLLHALWAATRMKAKAHEGGREGEGEHAH